jgi:hypothetical protein
LSLWFLWVLVTGVVFYLVRLVLQGLDQAEQFSGLLYWGYLLARGAAVGVIIGAAQGLVLLFYVKRAEWPRWVLATATGWAVRSLLLYLVSDWLENAFLGLSTPGLVAATGLVGLLLGAVVGLPQSFVLRPYVDHPGWWILVNAGASLVARVVVATGLLAGTLDDAVAMGVIDVTVTAGISSIFLVDMLRGSRMRMEMTQVEKSEVSVGSPAVAVCALGEQAEIGPGLFLTFHHTQIDATSIVWQGVVRNDTPQPVDFDPAKAAVQVTDNTGKPYQLSRATTDRKRIPAHESAQIVVAACILSYSPIPPGATYLDLDYTPSNLVQLIFRRYL